MQIVPQDDSVWSRILSRSKLKDHRQHYFDVEGPKDAIYSHVKVTIYPDGGIKRVRVMGKRAGGKEGSTTSQ